MLDGLPPSLWRYTTTGFLSISWFAQDTLPSGVPTVVQFSISIGRPWTPPSSSLMYAAAASAPLRPVPVLIDADSAVVKPTLIGSPDAGLGAPVVVGPAAVVAVLLPVLGAVELAG